MDLPLCVNCKHRVPENDPRCAPFAFDVCSHPRIGISLVSGNSWRTTCDRQRHINSQDASMYAILPSLFCGPEAKYFEAQDD